MKFLNWLCSFWYAVIAANVLFDFIPQWNSKVVFFSCAAISAISFLDFALRD